MTNVVLVGEVDWCTRRPTCKALKTRTSSGLHTWIVPTWEVFDKWAGVLVNWLVEPSKQGVVPDCTREGPCVGGVWLVDWCICGPTCRALKTRSRSGLGFLKKLLYWCFYLHWSTYVVSPGCGTFNPATSRKLFWSYYPQRLKSWCLPYGQFFLYVNKYNHFFNYTTDFVLWLSQ